MEESRVFSLLRAASEPGERGGVTDQAKRFGAVRLLGHTHTRAVARTIRFTSTSAVEMVAGRPQSAVAVAGVAGAG